MMQLYIVFHFVLYFRQPSVRVFFLHVRLEILLLLLYSVAIRRSISFFFLYGLLTSLKMSNYVSARRILLSQLSPSFILHC